MINFLEEDKKENMLQNGILAKFNGITILELPTLTDKSKYIKLSNVIKKYNLESYIILPKDS